jgi:hypothetical protein
MTRYTHQNTTGTQHANNQSMDWSRFTAQAMFDGGQAFLQAISSAPSTIDEAQLRADEKQADQQIKRALDYAKRDRANARAHLLVAVEHWSRKQAIPLLRLKKAGKPISPAFYQAFQPDLYQEITSMISDVQLCWDQEDAQQAAVKRQEAEQAFGQAHPYVIGLYDVVLDGERHRQAIFNDGVHAAQSWADRYEESVEKRAKDLEARIQIIQEQERENRAHQLALRELAQWDDRRSFVDSVIGTGKNALGCLLVFALVAGGILLAIYLAFPHH